MFISVNIPLSPRKCTNIPMLLFFFILPRRKRFQVVREEYEVGAGV